jgi:hypothetical protein
VANAMISASDPARLTYIKSALRRSCKSGAMLRPSLGRDIVVVVALKPAVISATSLFIFGPRQRPVADATAVATRVVCSPQASKMGSWSQVIPVVSLRRDIDAQKSTATEVDGLHSTRSPRQLLHASLEC